MNHLTSNYPAVLSTSVTVAVTVALLAVVYLYFVNGKKGHYGLFPSPPAHPIWGHAAILIAPFQWKAFAEMGKELGNIIYLSVFGQSIIVLNSVEDARELMEKRGVKYSGRAGTILYGLKDTLTFLPYGDQLRTQRRMMQQAFGPQAIKVFREEQLKQVAMCLDSLLGDQTDFSTSLKLYIEATVIKATYGHDVVSNDDKYVRLASDVTDAEQDAGNPGAALVDCFPILKHVPSWFPGASFKRDAISGKKKVEELINIPFDEMRNERGNGIRGPSLLERLLEEYEATGVIDHEYELNAKNATAVIYVAALDSTLATLTMFLLMMTLHPEVARRAQSDIDHVVGDERLPGFEDRGQLPYIDCILKEVLRIHPPSPFGLAHESTEEDTYQGKRIPTGSMIMPNIWNMMRDHRYFDDVDKFRPERFLAKVKGYKDSDEALNGSFPDDPSSVVFGFGRRICPGRHFADASIWLFMACFLATFDVGCYISPETGLEEKPKIELTSAIVSRVEPFKCRITPRNETRSKLVHELVRYL